MKNAWALSPITEEEYRFCDQSQSEGIVAGAKCYAEANSWIIEIGLRAWILSPDMEPQGPSQWWSIRENKIGRQFNSVLIVEVTHAFGHGRALQLWLFPSQRAIRFCTSSLVKIFTASLEKR